MKLKLLLATIASFGILNPADAAPIHLDFGLTAQDVQTGYTGVSGGASGIPNPFTVPSAALPDGETMTISTNAGSLVFRDRGNWTTANYGPEVDLFEDFFRAGTGLAAGGVYPTMTVALTGLQAATPYEFRINLYDGGINAAVAGTYSYLITGTGDTNPLNNNYNIAFHSGGPGMPEAARAGYTETLISDPFGNLEITIEQTFGGESSVPLNSFSLTVVPEPTTAVLGLAGALLLSSRRRRRTEFLQSLA